MKNLYMIGGTMGVGKTTVGRLLKKQLPDAVFLDGDWCWDADPFTVTAETKAMVLQNICFLLNQFLRCSAYKNIVFCWVLHEQAILDAILEKLEPGETRIHCVSLLAAADTVRARLQKDVAAGLRTPDVIGRSLARIPCYRRLRTVKIDTDGRSPAEIAAQIAQL